MSRLAGDAMDRGSGDRLPRRVPAILRHHTEVLAGVARRPSTWAVAIVAAHVGLLVASIPLQATAGDEFGHLPAGLAIWRTGAYYIYRENPPLPRMSAALPVLLTRRVALDTRGLEEEPSARPEWPLGARFLYANAGTYLELFRIARLTSVFWSLVGAGIAYRWAGQLHGERAGLLALVLWAFEPNLLAHAQLVTPDISATSLGLLAAYTFWRYLHLPCLRRAAVAGVALGLALLTKFTMLVLGPTFAIVVVFERLRGVRDPASGRAYRKRSLEGAGLVLLCLFVVNLGYGFERVLRPLGSFEFVSDALTRRTEIVDGPGTRGPAEQRVFRRENTFRGTPWASLLSPLPANYLLGLDSQVLDNERGYPAYLAGTLRDRGWWYYYLAGTALKVPLGFLALLALALAMPSARGVPASERSAVMLLIGVASSVFVLISSQTGINSHFRYVLPSFAPAIVLMSRAAVLGPAWLRAAVVALTAWGVVDSLAAYPHSLSYFNTLAGGPKGGHRYLLESNLDWGQDLLFLERWIAKARPRTPLRIACWTRIDPEVAGLDYPLPRLGPPPWGANEADPPDPNLGPAPGLFAISANLVHGFSLQCLGTGQQLVIVEAGRFTYFQHFTPVARVGDSIFIYEISLAQANAVRARLGLSPLGPPPAAQAAARSTAVRERH